MKKNEGSSFFGTKEKDEDLRSKKRRSFAIANWELFYFTLPGRIAVYKTLLMPQLNYIAAILTPTPEIIERISTIFERFVSNSINISKKRLYLSTDEGRLGLFKLENFIAALQSMWI